MSEQLFGQALRLHQSGNVDEAARLYRMVLQSNPRHFQALYLLGFAHYQWEKYEEAERLLGAAIAINPRQSDAHYNRGCALQKLKRDAEAVACFGQALALNRNYAEALFNRATSYLTLGNPIEALRDLEQVLRLTPNDAEAWHNRGNALMDLKRYPEARAGYARALAIAPALAFAPGKLVYAKLQCCDWAGLAEDTSRVLAAVRSGQAAAGPLELMLMTDSPADILAGARVTIAREHPAAAQPLWRGERYTHERIRIAYISPDLRAHAVAYQLAGVIAAHDRKRFETFAISHGPADDSAVRARLKAGFEHFLDMHGRSDAEIAGWLKANEIDIAVDLSGHTMASRISVLANRPAPIQVSYLGYPGPTGAGYMDYLIADHTVVPDTERLHYGEKIAFLPDTFFPTDATRKIAAPPARAAVGLPESGVVFCCFNPICKLTPESFSLWMTLLRQTESSVLWLPDQSEEARARLKDAAQAQNVAGERLVFAPFTATADEHLARLPLADLFLDTWPYNAHATASDALFMGVPVVTLAGRSFAARVAASLLGAIGLSELVTSSVDNYRALALKLAQEPETLSALRERLHRGRTSAPLFDTARYTANLEAAYVEMWERRRRGEAPADFSVSR
jgi:predicted O-linked N-acetylglucosamine transferase (SPINDLY family)